MNDEVKHQIIQKIDKMSDDINGIKVVLVKQELNLKNHMKRSDTLEMHYNLLQEEFRKIQGRWLMIDGAFKFVGFIAVLAAIWRALH